MLIDINDTDSAGVKVLKVIGSALIWLGVALAAFVSAIFGLAKKS